MLNLEKRSLKKLRNNKRTIAAAHVGSYCAFTYLCLGARVTHRFWRRGTAKKGREREVERKLKSKKDSGREKVREKERYGKKES